MAVSMIDFLRHKQALGRKYRTEYFTLRSLDRFLAQRGASDLDAETFLSWCETQKHVASGVRRAYMRTVRAFSLYRRRSEPGCYVPDSSLFPPEHARHPPYIFSEAEIARLLEQTLELARVTHTPLRPEAVRLSLVLLYCAGLRLGELLRLEVEDYDRAEGVLHIRSSKFHKSRKIPLSASAAFEVERYLSARRRLGRRRDTGKKLLWNGSQQGDGYGRGRLRLAIWQLLDREGIRDPDGRRPTIHSLRHTFAVHVLLRWYRNGVELQSRLPQLATYMGHVSIVSTESYLHFVADLVSVASARFASHSARLLGTQADPAENRS
jgi:integrase